MHLFTCQSLELTPQAKEEQLHLTLLGRQNHRSAIPKEIREWINGDETTPKTSKHNTSKTYDTIEQTVGMQKFNCAMIIRTSAQKHTNHCQLS